MRSHTSLLCPLEIGRAVLSVACLGLLCNGLPQPPLYLIDRDLHRAPAKVALGRVVFGSFFFVFFQPGRGYSLVQGEGLATAKALDVQHSNLLFSLASPGAGTTKRGGQVVTKKPWVLVLHGLSLRAG